MLKSPVVIDAGAAAGSLVWLGGWAADSARRFARALALALLVLSVAANALGHGLAAYALAPSWWVVVVVSAVAPAVLGAVVVGLLLLLILGAISFFRSELGNPELLWQQQLMPLVEKARQQLPAMLVDHLPDSVDDLRDGVVELARKHAVTLQMAGKEAARAFVHILIGLVLGAIVALSRTRPAHQVGPLAAALGTDRVHPIGWKSLIGD